MATKNEVATQQQPPVLDQAAPAKPKPPLQVISEGIDQMKGIIEQSLPSGMKVDVFRRVVMNSITLNPDLINADRRSLYNACLKCAADGLLPDGREAALVVYNTKQKYMDGTVERERWVKAVSYQPMYIGIIKKMRQSGEVSAVSAHLVYQKETESPGLDKDGNPLPPRFQYWIEDGIDKITHEPILYGDRGPVVLVYASVKFKDGTAQHMPMTKEDVEKVRQSSKAPNSPAWRDWWDQMAMKTALRRLSKWTPLSAEDNRIFDRDDEDPTDFDALREAAVQSAEQQTQSLEAATALLGASEAP